MAEWEKEQAIYSARYILEEYFEAAQNGNGVFALSNAIGYPPGVIHSALENIFSTKL